MGFSDDFADITRPGEPLAPYTALRVGGPADFFVQPRTLDELTAVIRRCTADRLPIRVLGGGSAILVPDEGVRGVVIRLTAPAFTAITVDGNRVTAGAGAALPGLISHAARAGLARLEALVGLPGTVGGGLRCNAGDRSGDIGQLVRSVTVLDEQGRPEERGRGELRFADHGSNLDDGVIISAVFELDSDAADAIVKRMRKAWIHRKAAQPYSFQPSARLFRDPRGLSAARLIEDAGLGKAKVGKAEVSDRNANFVVTQPGAEARDVLRLIDLLQARVREASGVGLERELIVW